MRNPWLSLGGSIVVVAALTTSGRQATLSSTPTLNRHWQFQISLPKDWSTISPEDRSRPILLDHFIVKQGDDNLTPDKSDIIISSEQPQKHDASFQPTIMVASQPMPPTIHDRASAINLIAHALASHGNLLTQLEPSQSIQHGHLVGVQARYQYVQVYENTRQVLSSQVAVLFDDQRLDRYFLVAATAPAAKFHRYRKLFDEVIASMHRSADVPAPS